jgi:hypothetical protein
VLHTCLHVEHKLNQIEAEGKDCCKSQTKLASSAVGLIPVTL